MQNKHKSAFQLSNFYLFQVETVRLQGLEHVLSFTATDEGLIYLRSYRIQLKKSGQRTPRIELEEIGKFLKYLIGYMVIFQVYLCIQCMSDSVLKN